MPELPEVETVKNQLAEKIVGKKIENVDIRLPKMVRGVTPAGFKKKVTGAKITKVSRRAKFLIIELNNNYALVIHLKMTGQLIYINKIKFQEELLKKHSHIIYYFDDGSIFLHNDMRQFGYVRLLEKDELGSFFTTFKIGPEPLERSFSLNKFKTLLATKPRLKIKPLLMDQTFLAGIGNLYAQEACWHAKILPNRFVKSLKEKEIECLYTSLRNILREAIKCKGSTVDTYVDANDEPGDYVKKIKVYSREHQTCLRCGEKIIKIILSGRGTCYCPNCQK